MRSKLFSYPTPNIDTIAFKLLKALGVKVNYETVSSKLREHPDYPGILALSDCLAEFNVAHETFTINKNEVNIDSFDYPFIASMSKPNGRLILVNNFQNGTFDCSDETSKNYRLSEKDFLSSWTGRLLYSQADEESGEIDYSKNRTFYFFKNLFYPFSLLLVILFPTLILSSPSFSKMHVILCILKTIGTTLCVLLLNQTINNNNPFLQNLCSLGGKNNCNTVLKSDAAKITPWLSWSELGFFYFSGSLLCLLVNPSAIQLLAYLNILALPYTLYSLIYQYRIKSWCILCCSVQVLLWLEFLCCFNLNRQPLNIAESASTIFLICTTFLLPLIGWTWFKPFLVKAAQTHSFKQQLSKFKYNSGLFHQALINQKQYAVADDLTPLVFGNPNAETTITIVSNPFCGPCATAHQTITKWLNSRDNIRLKVLFATANIDNDKKSKVAQHINSLGLLIDKAIAENALTDWFEQTGKQYKAWAEKYPVEINRQAIEITQLQKSWCEYANITFTPTIFINGYKMPQPYSLEDLIHLIN